MTNARYFLPVLFTNFCLILCQVSEMIQLAPIEDVMTRARYNASIPCKATNGTYVLRLEWFSKNFKLPDDSMTTQEVKLVEHTPESTTLFYHEGRISLNTSSYELSFHPSKADDSGIYDCVVNGQRRTTVNLIVQDVPDPPGRPLIMGFDSRSVNISWTMSTSTHHSPITHYIIHIRKGEEGHWDVDNGRATLTNDTAFRVTQLFPFTVYAFRVVAVNSIGQSLPSQESYFMVTLREKPEGKPIFTSASNSSNSSIRLHWEPPPLSTIHGEFLGYSLSITPKKSQSAVSNVFNIRDPKKNTFEVKGLKPFTDYLVSLKILNPEGSGPASTISVRTEEGIPGPPVNLTVLRVGDSSVDISWNRPLHPNGEVRGYRVYYMKGNFTSVRTEHGDGPTRSFTLTGLEPNSNFKIWTKAFTYKNEGDASEPVYVETDVSAPNAPIIANLTCESDTSLYLHWLRPALVYGAVHLYYINYRPEHSYQFHEIAVNSINDKNDHNFLISNLTENTMYEIKVRGGTYSKFYDENNLTYKGPFSEPRKILVFPDCHKASATDLTQNAFDRTSDYVAGAILAGFALVLLILAVIVWRRCFHGSYYYLEDQPKTAPAAVHDWENETGGEGAFGPVEVHDFAKHVQELHADGDIGFSKEYEAIQAASSQLQHTSEQSQQPENKQKNRYLNIVAYDHSRVPMRSLPGQKKTALEYVNANYIDGYNIARAYIGTQGPLPSTFDTFWRMVWEQRVFIIVMITNLVERGRKKCDQYWPKEGTENYGLIQVKLLQEDVLATYTIRKLAVKHLKVKCKKSGGDERIIYQYHYTNWPDHGTPDHPLPVLSFVHKSAAANPDDGGPIIVHCSAGVGRTGTYIVLDAMLQQIRAKGKLNIWGFLKHIRSQRNFLVQTEEQYIFIHDALLEAIQSGDSCIPVSGLSRYIRTLQANGSPSQKSLPSFLLNHQYKLVTNLLTRDFNIVNALKLENREKNRSMDFLPMESSRVHLTPKPGIEGSDYINATWLLGYHSLREFIVSQHPLANTLPDFWQMIWNHSVQLIVILTAVNVEEDYPQIWPSHNEDIEAEQWKVKFLEEKLHSGLHAIETIIESTQEEQELPVTIIEAPSWPQTIPSLSTPFSLISLVESSFRAGPIVVVDRFGGTEACTFCCLSTLKSQAETEHHLDPYMYFKLYHNRRPAIWQSQDDLLYIYTAMETLLASENASTNSSIDMADLAMPVMPPITNLTPPEPFGGNIQESSLILNDASAHQMLQNMQSASESEPDIITASQTSLILNATPPNGIPLSNSMVIRSPDSSEIIQNV